MSTSETTASDNSAQIDFWNGDAGQKWVEHADRLDTLLAPFIPAILAAAELTSGEQVVDIGCGAGALSFAAAEQVGADGGLLGVDISEPLLGLARQRAERLSPDATFEHADASVYQLSSPANVVVSRFGVMFFADPVGAFANIRSNVQPGGRMAFACWQGMKKNDWLRVPLETALPFFADMPAPPDPHAPGPFAFADAERVADILGQAGWSDVSVKPWSGALTLPGDTVREQSLFSVKMGPVARLIAEQVDDAEPVLKALDERFETMKTASGLVELGAAAWIVSARC